MAKQQPIVRQGHLYMPGASTPVTVGDPAWYAWLANAESFRYESEAGTFGARRERFQRGGWYWRAYRRVEGRLRRAYLGRPGDLTAERLAAVAAELAGVAVTPPPAASTIKPAEQPALLLETKLLPPAIRRGAIERPALVQWLDDALAHRLTVITAPAGYGKTTLLAQWCRSLEARRAAPDGVAWLSLDDDDNDAPRLWQYVVAALQRIVPELADVMPLFQLTALVNRLAGPVGAAAEPLVLVLDDYQAITDHDIHEALIQLVERLPERLHIVLASRAEPPLPLARWRAAGYTHELHTPKLRFSESESAAILRAVSGVELDGTQLTAVLGRTEGWAAGLHLAGLALRGTPNLGSAPTMKHVSGSHPFILDFLVDEIVVRQPPDVQQFLLQTSILGRLSGELCDAVVDAHDGQSQAGRSQAMLNALERANLFVMALDEQRHWFRYHPLFADALQAQLRRSMPDRVCELHSRAMAWYKSQLHRNASSMGAAALEHALVAGLPEQGLAIVEATAPEMLWYRGEMRTLLRWIESLPEARVRERPLVHLARCWALLATLQFARLEEQLRQGDRQAELTPEPYAAAHWNGHVAAIESYVDRISGRLESGLERGRQALALLPETSAVERHLVVMNLVSAYTVRGNIRAALDILDVLTAKAHEIDELPALLSRSGLLIGRASLLICSARLFEARDLLEQATAAVAAGSPRSRLMSGNAIGLIEQIELHYEWNELNQAEHLASQALDAGENWWNSDFLAAASYWLGRVRQARGDRAGGAALIQRSRDLGRGYNVPHIIREVEVYEAADALRDGDPAPARILADQRSLTLADLPAGEQFDEYEMLVRLAIAQGTPESALGLIGRLRSLAMEGEYTHRLIRVDILWALALHAGERTDEALAPLLLALTLAQPNHMIRIFADEGQPMRELLLALQRRFRSVQATPALQRYVGELLDTFGTRRATAPAHMLQPAGFEQLTAREVNVLDLMAAGASNQEIADALVVSVHTAKKHVSSILAKLGVASRAQAIARLRAASGG